MKKQIRKPNFLSADFARSRAYENMSEESKEQLIKIFDLIDDSVINGLFYLALDFEPTAQVSSKIKSLGYRIEIEIYNKSDSQLFINW